MEKNSSDRFVCSPAGGGQLSEQAQDLERRIRLYEELDARGDMDGALGSGEYTAIFLLTFGLVVTFYLWGY
ncbi:hypothetical protein [Marinobacterium sedimentorum]|uniref:hypothetical protein n=1 Tax=Marinobacterium sedimentorum TaxID=2927804 RepID=UPI0020C61ED6|nr:hypothetical protein [Marinobacterium sedimentorum]MCP8687514.1 hypothetical protein [Marinobacterium sedimentorum]